MLVSISRCNELKVWQSTIVFSAFYSPFLEKTSFHTTPIRQIIPCHVTEVKVEWYPIYGPKSLFKFGEKRPIVCYCTREQKINFESFTQNGCYGNQPQPFEVVF